MSALGPYALALIAGVLSFTSPCCLPLMPGYVSYVSGVAGSGSEIVAVRARVLGAALLFVLGFTTVFTLLGASASVIGSALLANRQVLIRVGGTFVILMGLVTMGLFRFPLLYRERRVDLGRIRSGPLGAVPLGMAFAVGWTPCIGPVLAGILTAAASTGTAISGATLLFVYSLGLGIPFILLALGYARGGRAFGWFRRHGRAIELFGGGVLLPLFTPLIRWFSRHQWPPI
ncbi:MAG: cytochrome C biogenesis protein [Actinobacteria bacterium]|nr:MAG: cytochrome C biogenesis protein [Actinomycetota bacterium]